MSTTKRCEEIFREAAGRHGMGIREIGFDRDHARLTVDAGRTTPLRA